MFKFRVFLATCLFFAALFSVQSHAMGVKHELNSNQSSYSHVVNVENLTIAPTPLKSLGNLQHKNSKHSEFAAHQPRLTANNSFLFLHSAQGDPEYDVVHEFFALNGCRHIFLRPQAVTINQPWYTWVFKSKKSRLSGWKDANLLYTAVTTYHA